MNARITAIALSALLATAATGMSAQSYTHISSTQGNEWSSTKGKMEKKAATAPVLEVARDAKGQEFKAWGITFNRSPMTMSLLISISFFFLPNIIKSPNEKSSFKLQGYYTHFTPLFQ